MGAIVLAVVLVLRVASEPEFAMLADSLNQADTLEAGASVVGAALGGIVLGVPLGGLAGLLVAGVANNTGAVR